MFLHPCICFLSGSRDGGIYMSDVVCESKMVSMTLKYRANVS